MTSNRFLTALNQQAGKAMPDMASDRLLIVKQNARHSYKLTALNQQAGKAMPDMASDRLLIVKQNARHSYKVKQDVRI